MKQSNIEKKYSNIVTEMFFLYRQVFLLANHCQTIQVSLLVLHVCQSVYLLYPISKQNHYHYSFYS